MAKSRDDSIILENSKPLDKGIVQKLVKIGICLHTNGSGETLHKKTLLENNHKKLNNAEIKIIDITEELKTTLGDEKVIKANAPQYELPWDCTDNSGKKPRVGNCFYLITAKDKNSGQKLKSTGKLTIIR